LLLATTEQFKVSFAWFGPTEMRVALIILNALIVKFGTRPVKGVLPYLAVGALVVLGILAFRTQRRLWHLDMQVKRQQVELK